MIRLFLIWSACNLLAADLISFDVALNEMMGRSTSIEIQKEKTEAVAARNWSSQYKLLPSISLEGSQSLSKVVGLTEREKLTYGIVGNINLFHFGADIAAMSAASNENEAHEYLVEDTTLAFETEATNALFQFIQSEAIVRSLQANLNTRTEAANVGQARYGKGLMAREEADKLSIDQSNAEAQLRDAEGDFANARAGLIQLLSHDRVEFKWPWKAAMGQVQEKFKMVQENALSERPDWKAAEKFVDYAHAKKRQGLGEALPSLDLSLSYARVEYRRPEPTSMGPEWQGALTLSIPLFDRFAHYGNYRSALHTARVAELDLEKTRRLARKEWFSARQAFEIAFLSAQSREKNLEISRKLYDTNSQRFRRGLIHANELMIDQERLYQAEVNAIRGWNAAHVQLLRACHALGKQFKNCAN